MEAGVVTSLKDKKCHLPDLRIVLLGGRWNGKSSAGNTILGREEFQSGLRTAQCVRRQGEVAGRQVTVVDTPGWIYMSVKDTPELVKQEIMHSVSLCPPGPCALLLVISVSSSFTESHWGSVEEHLQVFCERVWRHTMVLFTWGDCLGDTIIEKHIEAEGSALQWLVEKCGNRYHVLNNENRGDGTQVTELLEKIEEMVAGLGGCHYEMDRMLLQEVEEKRRAVKLKAKERMEVEKLRKAHRVQPGDKKYHLPDLRIVLLGWRRSGKSSARNTILGREEFESGIRAAQCVRRQGEVAGRQVTVVNTPGWRYMSVKDTPELVKQEIIHSVSLCPPGPCALLLVINLSSSFTESHRRSVEQHLQLLSERVWRHTIVLFTWGDCLGDTTIEQHIEAEGKALQWLVEKCGNRFHVLNNENRGDGTQVTELLEKAEEMVAGLGACHDEMNRILLQEVEEKRRAGKEKAKQRMEAKKPRKYHRAEQEGLFGIFGVPYGIEQETTESRRALEEREKICKSQHSAVQPVPGCPPPPVQPVPGCPPPLVQPVPGFPSPPVQPVPGPQDSALEFVDQHREALIQRVSLVKPIADALLQRKLLQEEAYDKICAEKTSQDQMRTLYQFLKSSTVKSALYAELLKKEPFLVKDLGAV